MVFSSHIFLFYFLPFTLFFYYLMVWSRVSLSWINLFVTFMSYAFYGWLHPWFVSLMWISTIVDYACGRAISRPELLSDRKNITGKALLGEFKSLNIFYPFFILLSYIFSLAGIEKGERREKWIRNGGLLTSMAVNLGLLGYFKYAGFFTLGVNRIMDLFGFGPEMLPVLNIFLPAGISFYTFQTMSYTIDVWRGDAPPVKDMRTFSCFVALFPQLIAGPIIRYNTVAEQLAHRRHSFDKFTSGVAIFILGLSKKLLLADAAGKVADAAFGADAPGVLGSWWGILGYSFQIYFDFCGYSDMAVGLGRMMGFEFIKNFNGPYRAQSISDFWNRWHISLSTWIRDYLYIALGGNRKGPKRTYFNLVTAMFLCGLWHGAKMTFVIWGVFHGALLIWERTMGRQPIYKSFPLPVKIILTNIIVLFGWVLFRAPSLDQAMHFWGSMVGAVEPAASAALLRAELFSPRHVVEMLACGFFVYQPIQAHNWVNKLSPWKFVVLAFLLLWSLATMFWTAFSPFLYFQF